MPHLFFYCSSLSRLLFFCFLYFSFSLVCLIITTQPCNLLNNHSVSLGHPMPSIQYYPTCVCIISQRILEICSALTNSSSWALSTLGVRLHVFVFPLCVFKVLGSVDSVAPFPFSCPVKSVKNIKRPRFKNKNNLYIQCEL